jgi:hypothetical protein
MMDDKRKLREEKREIKKAGNRRVRRLFDAALKNDPDIAHEIEMDFGKLKSIGLNGIDRRENEENS